MENNIKVQTTINDIVTIKQVYNFITLKYDNIKIISIEFKDETLSIYFESDLFHYYKDIIAAQNEVQKFLVNNLSKEIENINIIKI